MTFFYRQMRPLFDRGYLYIAQPPLYKVKKGKSERYIKDEKALEEYLLDLALSNCRVLPEGASEPLSADAVRALAGHASEYSRLLRMLARRRFDERVVAAAVAAGVPTEQDLRDAAGLRERVAPRISEQLRLVDPSAEEIAWVVSADPEHDAHRLVATSRRAGVTHRSTLDGTFLRSPDWSRLSALVAQMAEIGGRGSFRIETDAADEPEVVMTAPRVFERLLELAEKGLSIQRYKGLGEMNPDQLADTTMDIQSRTLLQVKVEDGVEADLVFSTLMGDDVEPRRDFIEKNALNVQNLDI
jgi:DNA gyrase subunit B